MNDDKDSEDGEVRSFREAMRGVRRLRQDSPGHRTSPKPPPRARFRRADEAEVLRESLRAPIDASTLEMGDELSFRRPHVPQAVLTRLRRGHFTVEAQIDLHGLTGAQAKVALRQFIGEALQQRMSCVRVIHGKGRRSGPRGPVLKNVVNQWLQRADDVLAFGSARAVDGGSGAVYILLRSRSGSTG
jgi:DNA-nicking Smr family endonuclease